VAKLVGQVIRELREAAGLPRTEVARKAKIDPSVLWRLENPKKGAQPSFDLVARVVAALGVSLDDVILRTGRAREGHPEPTVRDHLDRIVMAVDELRRELNSPIARSHKK
jgi:transcriptional regulator with XRE-family HTH domain